MRRSVSILLLASTLACAGERAVGPGAGPAQVPTDAPVLRAAELARVRCLLVAPFDNGSDAPLAADAATNALVSDVDPARAKVFPIPELRALFRETPLELPAGVGPSLALELAELIGADAALYGSVEGRSRDGAPELLVTIRLSLAADHRLLFAQSVLVTPASDERIEAAVRSAVLAAARPALTRLGDDGRKRCFDPERARTLRKVALAEAAEARAAHPHPPPGSPSDDAMPPAGAASPLAASPAPARTTPRTSRQAEWAKRLEGGERIVVEEVAFAGRSAELHRDIGLADLAVALLARPAVTVRLEGFVDTTSDHGADQKLSASMAQAAAQRLAELGVPVPRVSWGGRGGESPRLPNFTARGRAANRRIEAVSVR
jgi:outer membrane protein OmpA-like peptidoglycan-associated protein